MRQIKLNINKVLYSLRKSKVLLRRAGPQVYFICQWYGKLYTPPSDDNTNDGWMIYRQERLAPPNGQLMNFSMDGTGVNSLCVIDTAIRQANIPAWVG